MSSKGPRKLGKVVSTSRNLSSELFPPLEKPLRAKGWWEVKRSEIVNAVEEARFNESWVAVNREDCLETVQNGGSARGDCGELVGGGGGPGDEMDDWVFT